MDEKLDNASKPQCLINPNPFLQDPDAELMLRAKIDYSSLSADEKRYYHEWVLLKKGYQIDPETMGYHIAGLGALWLDKVNELRFDSSGHGTLEGRKRLNKLKEYEYSGNILEAQEKIASLKKQHRSAFTKKGNLEAASVFIVVGLVFAFLAWRFLTASGGFLGIGEAWDSYLRLLDGNFLTYLILFAGVIAFYFLFGSISLGIFLSFIILFIYTLLSFSILGCLFALITLICMFLGFSSVQDALTNSYTQEQVDKIDAQNAVLKEEREALEAELKAYTEAVIKAVSRPKEHGYMSQNEFDQMSSSIGEHLGGSVSYTDFDIIIKVITQYYKGALD